MSSAGYVTVAVLVSALLWMPGYGQEDRCFQEEQNDVCEDRHQFCTAWAEDGQCKNTAQWMLANCPKACGRCDKFAVKDFTMAVFKELSLSSSDSVFMSPYSIWSAFILAFFGSEGTTKEQLQAALGVRGKMDTYTKWRYMDYVIGKPHQENGATFRSLNKAYFDTSVPLKRCMSKLIYNIEEVDFSDKASTTDIINGEVRRATEGMITELIEPDDLRGANFLLLNAVYFKGKWETPFNSNETRTVDFYDEDNANNVLGNVMMMYSEQRKIRLVQYDPLGADIVEIPYYNSSISMILIKPYWDVATVDGVLSNLTSDSLEDAMSQMGNFTVLLGIPKFRMETRIDDDLLEAIYALGVTDLFSGQADLSGFSKKPLRVDKVIHEAVVEVTEEGTKAAAATAVVGMRNGKYELIMNKPFIFLIYDKSANVMLFAGTFRHPDDAESLSTENKAEDDDDDEDEDDEDDDYSYEYEEV